jgi:hypothetical protein
MPVSPEDSYCRNCGANLRKPRLASTPASAPSELLQPEMPPPSPPTPPYERKYGILSRLVRVVFNPSETMKDIALAPDYSGVIVILVAQVLIGIVTVAYQLTKVSITGPSAGLAYAIFYFAVIFAFVLSFILYPVKWLIKSVLVWKLGDAGSRWTFKSAASVTGYAYMANLILSLVSLPVIISFIPAINIDISNIEAARQWLASYQSQLAALELTFTLPSLLLALLWKSYLGALGTNYGTKQMCKVSSALLIFFLLGLITIAWSLFT